jgi:hypothetical protein
VIVVVTAVVAMVVDAVVVADMGPISAWPWW